MIEALFRYFLSDSFLSISILDWAILFISVLLGLCVPTSDL